MGDPMCDSRGLSVGKAVAVPLLIFQRSDKKNHIIFLLCVVL